MARKSKSVSLSEKLWVALDDNRGPHTVSRFVEQLLRSALRSDYGVLIPIEIKAN